MGEAGGKAMTHASLFSERVTLREYHLSKMESGIHKGIRQCDVPTSCV